MNSAYQNLIKILQIPNSDWFPVVFKNYFHTTGINVEAVNEFIDDGTVYLLWFKHHGDPTKYPVKHIYDGTVLDTIPKEWHQAINDKKIRIVIDTMEESWGPYYYQSVNQVESKNLHLLLEYSAERIGINPEQIVWITGDMNAEQYCSGSSVKVKSICMFLWSYVNLIKHAGYQLDDFIYDYDLITNFVISPNRMPKVHRAYSVYRLHKMQQEKNVYPFNHIKYSFPKELETIPDNKISSTYRKLLKRKENWQKYFDRNNNLPWMEIKKHIHELEYELPKYIDINNFDQNNCAGADAITLIGDHFRSSAVSLITETWAEGGKLFISDAILTSILHTTPFIVVGNRGTLDFLKQKGFKTYSEFWNESYDLIEDDADRWQSALDQLEKIGKELLNEHSKWYDFRKRSKEITQYNVKHMFNIAEQEEQNFYNYMLSLVSNNFKDGSTENQSPTVSDPIFKDTIDE